MSRFEVLRVGVCAVLVAAFGSSFAAAATLYNEGGSGDLSNNQAAPTAKALALGTNSVIGNVNNGSGDSQDWIALTVPAGGVLDSIVLASYTSSDLQGFTGFHSGATFAGNAFSAGAYNGYAHFGTSAVNGSLPAANLVGVDLLPLMADTTNVSVGATGFTSPLSAGTYTFLIQQLGGSTGYQFDFHVASVPEPSTLVLGGLGAAALLIAHRRLRRRIAR